VGVWVGFGERDCGLGLVGVVGACCGFGAGRVVFDGWGGCGVRVVVVVVVEEAAAEEEAEESTKGSFGWDGLEDTSA